MPPPRNGYAKLNAASTAPPRDSLELASLASSTPSKRSSADSSPPGISSSRKMSMEDGEQEDENGRPRAHSRTYSISSAFDFANNLFPLSTTAAGYTALGTPIYNPLEGPSLEKHKSLTFLNGLSLVIGLIIGSGIFSSPSQVNINAGSPGASLVVWALAGILAWTGAASFAELGGAIPLNGGAQVYLTKIFGDLAGFLFTWSAVLVLKPGSAAIISIIFGEYVVRAAVGAEAGDVSVWVNKGVALGGLVLVTILNSISTRLGTRMGDLFLILKFAALLGVTVVGIVVAATGFSYDGKLSQEWKHENWFAGTNQNLSNWAVALYAGLWAFDGWDNVSHIQILQFAINSPTDKLCRRRIPQSSPRPSPSLTHRNAPSNPFLPPSKHVLHIRPPHLSHKLIQHHSRKMGLRRLRPHWLPLPRNYGLTILLRSPQRNNIHLWPPRLRRWKRRLPPLNTRQNRGPGFRTSQRWPRRSRR